MMDIPTSYIAIRAKAAPLDFFIFTVPGLAARPAPLRCARLYVLTVFLCLFYDISVKRDIFMVTANSSSDLARTAYV